MPNRFQYKEGYIEVEYECDSLFNGIYQWRYVYYDSADPHIALSKNQLLLFGKELDLIMRTQKLYSKRQMLSALASIKDALKTPSTPDDPIENKKDGDTADTTTSDSDTEQYVCDPSRVLELHTKKTSVERGRSHNESDSVPQRVEKDTGHKDQDKDTAIDANQANKKENSKNPKNNSYLSSARHAWVNPLTYCYADFYFNYSSENSDFHTSLIHCNEHYDIIYQKCNMKENDIRRYYCTMLSNRCGLTNANMQHHSSKHELNACANSSCSLLSAMNKYVDAKFEFHREQYLAYNVKYYEENANESLFEKYDRTLGKVSDAMSELLPDAWTGKTNSNPSKPEMTRESLRCDTCNNRNYYQGSDRIVADIATLSKAYGMNFMNKLLTLGTMNVAYEYDSVILEFDFLEDFFYDIKYDKEPQSMFNKFNWFFKTKSGSKIFQSFKQYFLENNRGPNYIFNKMGLVVGNWVEFLFRFMLLGWEEKVQTNKFYIYIQNYLVSSLLFGQLAAYDFDAKRLPRFNLTPFYLVDKLHKEQVSPTLNLETYASVILRVSLAMRKEISECESNVSCITNPIQYFEDQYLKIFSEYSIQGTVYEFKHISRTIKESRLDFFYNRIFIVTSDSLRCKESDNRLDEQYCNYTQHMVDTYQCPYMHATLFAGVDFKALLSLDTPFHKYMAKQYGFDGEGEGSGGPDSQGSGSHETVLAYILDKYKLQDYPQVDPFKQVYLSFLYEHLVKVHLELLKDYGSPFTSEFAYDPYNFNDRRHLDLLLDLNSVLYRSNSYEELIGLSKDFQETNKKKKAFRNFEWLTGYSFKIVGLNLHKLLNCILSSLLEKDIVQINKYYVDEE